MTDPLDEQEIREHCCADWPKPCSYHEGWFDGWEARDIQDAREELIEEETP